MKQFKDIAVIRVDCEDSKYNSINFLESYMNIKDDSEDEEYVITKKELDLLMQEQIDEFICDLIKVILDFNYCVKILAESKASEEPNLSSSELYNKAFQNYMTLHDYNDQSKDKEYFWQVIPNTFEEYYTGYIAEDGKYLGITYDEIFNVNDEILVVINKLSKLKERFENE